MEELSQFFKILMMEDNNTIHRQMYDTLVIQL